MLIHFYLVFLARAQDYLSANEMLAQYPSCAQGFMAEIVFYPMAEACEVSPSSTPTQGQARCLCLAGGCDSSINATFCAEFYNYILLQLTQSCTQAGICDFARADNFVYSDYCWNLGFAEVEDIMGDGFMDPYQVSTTLPAACAGASAGAGAVPSLSAPMDVPALSSSTGTCMAFRSFSHASPSAVQTSRSTVRADELPLLVNGVSLPVGTLSGVGIVPTPSATWDEINTSQSTSATVGETESSASASTPTLPESKYRAARDSNWRVY